MKFNFHKNNLSLMTLNWFHQMVGYALAVKIRYYRDKLRSGNMASSVLGIIDNKCTFGKIYFKKWISETKLTK